MEISIYSTIDFSQARNLLTERQRDVKAFNPIVPQGGCISILELNPQQYISISWVFINQKTGKITSTTAQSSDSMHYVAIPENLSFGTYVLKITTTQTGVNDMFQTITTSKPFEYVKASSDIVTIVSRNADNDLVGNVPPNATVIQPIYINPFNLVDLADVNISNIADGQVVAWNAASGKFKNVYQSGGGGGTSFWEVEDAINIKPINGKKIKYENISNPPTIPTSGGGGFIQQALTDGASIAWNVANGNYGTVTLGGNRTISNPSNFAVGQELIIEITQDGAGTRLATWDSYFTFPGGVVPILSAGAGDVDRLRFIARSATVLSFESANFDI